MASIVTEIRKGAYYDSVVLMQLQRSLVGLDGVLDAGVVMGTQANKDVLAQSNLLTDEAKSAAAEDLVIAINGEDEDAAQAALEQVDNLLRRRRAQTTSEYRPKSIDGALDQLPDAGWVLVSVPGRYAAGVARKALERDKHVFLYSDNVPLDDEIELKQAAREKGLLVMGPDCGTAIVNGVGLGFANNVRRGNIGIVAASGTGLQEVSALIDRLGAGITHAIGTGGRDLKEDVGAITFLQGLDALGRDPDTDVIVLISKPPSPIVVQNVLRAARAAGKPVVVDFIGYEPTNRDLRYENIVFARTLSETAQIAVDMLENSTGVSDEEIFDLEPFAAGQRYLRGLFSGGTLAFEALLLLQEHLGDVYSNTPLNPDYALEAPGPRREHSILDLGEDEFTVGRLHPMLDSDLRIRYLKQEAEDPDVAVVLLDVVLGYGAHADPASELAPAIAEARQLAAEEDRYLEVVAVVVGTDDDPQNYSEQVTALQEAGARVMDNNVAAVRYAGALAQALAQRAGTPVALDALNRPFAAINVGIESFYTSLQAQEAPVVWVDWRPPAGGNEKLMSILERLKD